MRAAVSRQALTRLVALAVLAAVIFGVRAEAAAAGAYLASVCDPEVGTGRQDAAFTRSTRHYDGEASCGADGKGLTVTHTADHSPAGAWGGWTVRAPRGTSIARIGLSAAGVRRAGHTPEILVGPVAAPLARLAPPTDRPRRLRWSGGPASSFTARLRCRPSSGCVRGHAAIVWVKAVRLKLLDRSAPSLDVAGSLLDEGSRRGTRSLETAATDRGSGVGVFLAEVNGEPLAARRTSCALRHGVALRLRPCPAEASATIGLDTSAPPFRQGGNSARICALDYAARGTANRDCARGQVRVDNLCPVSAVAGSRLVAHLNGGRSRLTLGLNERATVSGRLTGGGESVRGARVCIAATRRGRRTERVVAAPTTGADGRFSAALPAGPSRHIRVAHWPDADRALERHLELRVRAAPRLRLHPAGRIENGRHVRFAVTLPRPERAHRRVRIQARSASRWLDVRAGTTGAKGVFRSSYRFHATTAQTTYAFRALVPRQRGYPYEAGASRTRRVTVVP